MSDDFRKSMLTSVNVINISVTVVLYYLPCVGRCHDLPKRTERDRNGLTKIPKQTSRTTQMALNKHPVANQPLPTCLATYLPTYKPIPTYLLVNDCRFGVSPVNYPDPDLPTYTYLLFLPTELTFITLHHLTYRHTYLP